jgi:putative ABC transport system permease protein
MFKNYIKVAIRNSIRSKFFSLTNIIGLVIGMTVCLLILMYVISELSYENFHDNRDRIYRICLEWGKEENKMKFAGSMPAIAPVLEAQIPEVIKATRIRKDYNAVIIDRDNHPVEEKNLFFADPAIFDIFSFKIKKGNKSSILVEPFTAVISQSVARRYFGDKTPLGETLKYGDFPLKITGIFEDIPTSTHLSCEILVSYSTRKALNQYPQKPWNHWGDDFTYLLLPDDVDLKALAQKMNDLLLKNTDEWFASRMKLIIQPINEIHWDIEARGDIGPKGNKNYIYLFLSAALLILFVACFNFMNLSTSHYFKRMKEVGIRKVIGARQNQLIKQFLTESLFIVLISIIISFASFETVHPFLYSYLNSTLVLESFHFQYLYAIIIGLIIFVGIFTGGYPAFYISRLKPVEILKKKSQFMTANVSFRKILIVLQFAISIILIIGSIIIFKQLDYMKNSDLGFEKHNVVLIQVPYGDEKLKQNYTVLRDELLKNSAIVSVSSAYTVPGINSKMNISVLKAGAPPESSVNLQALPADYGYASALNLSILAGRDFSKEFSLDKSESVILNQSAVRALSLQKPIGTKLKIPGDEHSREVIGVVADFHIQSLHHKINPMLIYINPGMMVTIAIKILPESIPFIFDFIKITWNRVLPDIAFNYRLLEDTYDQLYTAEKKTGILLSVFSLLAVFISCLGLLGMASLIASQKTKEMGVRKVLGATTTSILVLFSKEFSLWIIIANTIAWPIIWFVMNKWLQNFAYRSDINWWIFIIAGFISLLIALITISSQALRAAHSNPIEALRYE